MIDLVNEWKLILTQILMVQHTSLATFSGQSTGRSSTHQWLLGRSTWHPTSRKSLPAWNGMRLCGGRGRRTPSITQKLRRSIFSVKIDAMLLGQPHLMRLWWNITWHYLIWETNDSAQHSSSQLHYSMALWKHF